MFSWQELEALCASLGLQVFAKWRPSTEIKAELADLVTEGEALSAVAEEKGELDEIQNSRWNEIFGEEGLLKAKQDELDSIEAVEKQKKEMAIAKARSNSSDPFQRDEIDPAPQPRVVNSIGRLKAFKGENALQDAHDAGMWFRALLAQSKGRCDEQAEKVIARRGWGFQATATEGTDSAGGYTVPDPVSAAFIEFRESTGVARQVCHIEDMTVETKKVPKLTAGPTVQYPGEATATTATDQTWGNITLTAVERSILSKVSNPLAADSLINFVDNVISRFGYEFALQEDNEFINGDGTATYGGEEGLLDQLGAAGKFTAAAGVDTWAELTMDDFTETMAILPSKHRRNTGWICSSNFYYSVMVRLLMAGGGNGVADIEGGPTGTRFLGRPVYLTDWMPTSSAADTVAALFGTFSDGCMIGDRSPLEVMTSEHRFFEERVLGIIGVSRYDIKVHEGGDGSDAGAYVGLSTAA